MSSGTGSVKRKPKVRVLSSHSMSSEEDMEEEVGWENMQLETLEAPPQVTQSVFHTETISSTRMEPKGLFPTTVDLTGGFSDCC